MKDYKFILYIILGIVVLFFNIMKKRTQQNIALPADEEDETPYDMPNPFQENFNEINKKEGINSPAETNTIINTVPEKKSNIETYDSFNKTDKNKASSYTSVSDHILSGDLTSLDLSIPKKEKQDTENYMTSIIHDLPKAIVFSEIIYRKY